MVIPWVLDSCSEQSLVSRQWNSRWSVPWHLQNLSLTSICNCVFAFSFLTLPKDNRFPKFFKYSCTTRRKKRHSSEWGVFCFYSVSLEKWLFEWGWQWKRWRMKQRPLLWFPCLSMLLCTLSLMRWASVYPECNNPLDFGKCGHSHILWKLCPAHLPSLCCFTLLAMNSFMLIKGCWLSWSWAFLLPLAEDFHKKSVFTIPALVLSGRK